MNETTYNAFCDESIHKLPNKDLDNLKSIFGIINVCVGSIGVAGNILNLFTLRSPLLQTVPFKYIRALAVYDTVALTTVLFHYFFRYTGAAKNQILGFYVVYVEDLIINSFFIAGLYCAVSLTVERYLLLRNPHKKRIFNTSSIMCKLILILCGSIILHLPMTLQVVPKRLPNGIYVKGNNQGLLCGEGNWFNLYSVYSLTRESLRGLNVIILVALNYKISKKLQKAKRNRKQLIKRPSTTDNSDAFGRNDKNTLMRSFTEKRLTTLMMIICIVYALGNVPQTIVMLFQNESKEATYNFQIFRHIANTCEVLNHCLNFFMFCMASSSYSRAFLSVCPCAKAIPCCNKLMLPRRFTLSEYASESKVAFGRKASLGAARRSSIANRNQGYARRNTAALILHNSVATTSSSTNAGTTMTAVTPVDMVATIGREARLERRRSTRRRSTPTVGFHGIRMSLSDEIDDGCLVIENAICEGSDLLTQTKAKTATDFRDGDDFL
uniref:G_PROTEIN_RECEP_F1_2 domain-containing protein n=1 Tax=Panagrellus redivivus TaxID=6233 RepID=A0A7E4VJQ2_PANRE